jgi:histidinol-phosphate aminotransferase
VPVPLRPAVTGLPAYVAGRPAPARPDLVTYKMSSNENPFPPLPGVLEAVAQASASMNRYPDIANALMAEALGARLGVDADRLAFGTGSVGVLYHLLQAVCGPGDEVVHAWRSFEAYPIAVLLTGARWVGVPLGDAPGHRAEHDLEAMLAAVGPATRAVLLCSPNNPTGPALGHDDVVAFVDAVPDDVLVVVDEAYVEFVTAPTAVRGLEVAEGRDNVVVLRTFSKAYGLAGLRVGYAIAADPALTAALRQTHVPFSVTTVAQEAALASLEPAAEAQLNQRVAEVVTERDRVRETLRGYGYDVPPTQANFVWIPLGDATASWAAACEERKVIVRGFAGHGARITVSTPQENDRFLAAAAELAPG